MKKLQQLCFIDVKPGKSGPIGNAIIWNPHLVIRWHKDQGTPGLTSSSFNALLELALEIGAQDMIGEDLPDFARLSKEVSRTEGAAE